MVTAKSFTAREDRYAQAFALLNSHCKLLRVWAGIGLWDGEDFLLADSMAVQRWRGCDTQVEALVPKLRELLDPRESPAAREATRLAMAQHVTKQGYPGRGRPNVAALIEKAELEKRGDSRVDWAFALVRAARKGNIAPSTAGRRFVKGIRRPDGYWQVAGAAYEAISV